MSLSTRSIGPTQRPGSPANDSLIERTEEQKLADDRARNAAKNDGSLYRMEVNRAMNDDLRHGGWMQ